MSEPTNFLKGQSSGTEVLVPLLLLDGNYISYTSLPASPNSEGVEGLLKTAPDGLYYFADGLWRKTPAYTTNWDDLDENVRFLPINKNITLTKAEQLRLLKALSLTAATQTQLGLVKGSSRSDTQGAVTVSIDGSLSVLQATDTYAGVVRVTETSTDGYAPIVATKGYVDSLVTSTGTIVPKATATSIGGLMLGGDVTGNDTNGRISIVRASHTSGQLYQTFGLTHIAPPEFTLNPGSSAYDDATQDLPYVTTVSQSKAIARDIVQNTPIVKTDYVASQTELGFVLIAPDSALSITTGGSLSVNAASTTNRGTVVLYDQLTGNGIPNMQQVSNYLISLNYLTALTLPIATQSLIGGIKLLAEGPFSVDSSSGILRIRDASTQNKGVVLFTTMAPVTEDNTIFTAYRTQQLIDEKVVLTQDATPSISGKVLVLLGQGDAQQGPYAVPTVNSVSGLIDSLLNSSSFTTAVNNVIDQYPFHSPFPGGIVDQVLTFTKNTVFQDLAGDTTPGTVQFYLQPSLKGTNGAIKQTYGEDDILNYRQTKALISSGTSNPVWATYDGTTNTVTITGQVNHTQPITVAGTISATGNISTDGAISADGGITAGSAVISGGLAAGAITGTLTSLGISVLSRPSLVTISASQVVIDTNLRITQAINTDRLSSYTQNSSIILDGSIEGNNMASIENISLLTANNVSASYITIGTLSQPTADVLNVIGAARANKLKLISQAEPEEGDLGSLLVWDHKLYLEGKPLQQAKTSWNVYMFGHSITDAWYNALQGYLSDGTSFILDMVSPGKASAVVSNMLSAYGIVTVARAVTKDELYPALLDAVFWASGDKLVGRQPDNPVFITIVD